MNKAEMIDKMAEKTPSMTKKNLGIALDAILKSIEEALVSGDSVKLTGFGTFETKERKSRTGRNPLDPDAVVEIPAYRAPVFKAGKNLKEAVNK